MSGVRARPPRAVEYDHDGGFADCPEHGRQSIGSKESRASACVCVRQFLELRDMGLDGWRVVPGGPVAEVRS